MHHVVSARAYVRATALCFGTPVPRLILGSSG